MDNLTTPRDRAPRRFMDSPALYLLLGVASAIVGLLPWLITGMRLPLQNLWELETLPVEMPITLLPFSQYEVTLIAAMIITGAALAGGIARLARRRQRPASTSTSPSASASASPPASASASPSGVLALAGGVLLVQVIATIQTAVVTADGLQQSSASDLYMFALVVGTIAAIALGLLVLLLIARSPAPGATIAISFAAVAAASWMDALIVPFGTVVVSDLSSQLLRATYWLPAIIVGLAIAWCGVGTIGRALGSFTALLLLWLTPALVTAITSAAGTRVLTPYPAEMAEYAVQVFFSALAQPGWSARLVLVAAIVAVMGMAIRWMLRRRARNTAAPQP